MNQLESTLPIYMLNVGVDISLISLIFKNSVIWRSNRRNVQHVQVMEGMVMDIFRALSCPSLDVRKKALSLESDTLSHAYLRLALAGMGFPCCDLIPCGQSQNKHVTCHSRQFAYV